MHHLLPYLDLVKAACSANRVYWPPSHTVRPYAPCGLFFDDLHPLVQHKALTQGAPLVYDCFMNPKYGLMAYSRLRYLLQGTSSQGFDFLRVLMTVAGHPAYCNDAPETPVPRQRRNQSFTEYYHQVLYYQDIRSLGGRFLGERYFVSIVIDGATLVFKNWLDWLSLKLDVLPFHKPLPEMYSHTMLLLTIEQKAMRCGMHKYLTKSAAQEDTVPRGVTNWHINLLGNGNGDAEGVSIPTDDSALAALIHAVSSNNFPTGA